MIRARLQTEKGPMYILGIDAGNVQRLEDGKPILVDLATLGGEGRVVVLYGTTMAHLKRDLEAAFGPLPPAQPLTPGHA
jgi:hypothetical protein